MEQHQLTKKEYADFHKLMSEKRAVKELLESLKTQLAHTLVQEDKWWQKVASKYDLDHETMRYTIDHEEQCLIGLPRPQQRTTPQQHSHMAAPPATQRQHGEGATMQVRPRQASQNAMLSEEEILNIEKARQQFESKNGGN